MLKPHVNHAFVKWAQAMCMAEALTVGGRIRQQRKAKGLDIAPLAIAAGITPSALSQIETGKTKSPTPDTLFRIADALDVEPRWLVFGHHDRVAPSLVSLSLTDTARIRMRRNRT